jgi:FdhE protein
VTSSINVEALKRRRPEWSPWLSVVETALEETLNPRWDAAVPEPATRAMPEESQLQGASIDVDVAAIRTFLARLIDAADRNGATRMAALGPALQGGTLDLTALFGASLRQDGPGVAAIATASGLDPERLQAMGSLVSLPLLHACNRRWSPTRPAVWTPGYCPVCASWPAFAEMRGIERSRYLRCGRCGAEWHAHVLHCAFCGTTDHEELTSLVPESPGASGAIDACRRCRRYLKVFTRLQGCAPAAVMLEDLGSVDLDVAAIEQGYTRPEGPGRALDLKVVAGSTGRFLAWNS